MFARKEVESKSKKTTKGTAQARQSIVLFYYKNVLCDELFVIYKLTTFGHNSFPVSRWYLKF